MRVEPATIDHLAYVLEHVSDQNCAELMALGIPPEEIGRRYRGFVALGAEAAFIGEELVCVGGILPDNVTWFVATPAYFAAGPAAVLHARRYIRNAVAARGRLTTITRSAHPDVERWFRLLGYELLSRDGETRFFAIGDNPEHPC